MPKSMTKTGPPYNSYAATASTIPVSYTHLDVYKRQDVYLHVSNKTLLGIRSPFDNPEGGES